MPEFHTSPSGDGNQPAARVHPYAYAREKRWREKAEAERDEARADLAALRAEVAKVRDFLSRGTAYVGHDAADRLTAILDGDDQ